jgi:AraC-like DNA-binding protein
MHLKSFLLFIIVVISNQLNYSQNSKYDKTFAETAQVLLSSNPKKALSNTDYLYKISKNNLERIKACMLRATLLRQYGLRNDAIKTLKRADSLVIIDKNNNMEARINGFLSTLYRENEIYSIGKIHLQKAVTIGKKIEDKNEMYKFLGNLSQEIAYYEMHALNYSKAISNLKAGNQSFRKAGPSIDVNFHTAVNDELIAKNYLLMKKVDSSLIYYQKATKELEASQSPNSPLKGFIYNGFGNVYTSAGNYDKALLNYQKAEKIAEASNFFALKQEVYTSLLELYKKTDNKKYIAYNEMNIKLNKDDEYNRKIIADDLIKTLRKKQVDNQSNYRKSRAFIIGICIFIVLLTIGIYIYRRKQDYKKFKKFIDKSALASVNEEENQQEDKEITPKKDTAKEYMPEATEISILKGLQELKKSHYYLNKDISLNSVATELNINQRYLSYVINKHKSKDFAGYINELRINYIIDKLKNDDRYLKYKISYLADQCGFSSHSRFTITFKKVTGVSPLNFITYLQKEREESK